jgi:hypothetical protein
MRKEEIYCSLCGREIPDTRYQEKHHTTPVAKGGRDTELVCIDCGDQIHMLFTNNELRDLYYNINLLRSQPSVQKWVKWVRKQKNFGICMKRKKKR